MILDWPDCQNVRELGGLTTTAGESIRPGALFRSGNHDRLTPPGIDLFRRSGITRIVDLRSPWECEKYPSPFGSDSCYRNVPLIPELDPSADDGLTEEQSYRLILDDYRPGITAAFGALAEAPPSGVIVHCHAGRDRTGILVGLALAAVGVPDEIVAEDYALTDGCRAEVMLSTLAHLRRRYGGVERYLRDAGTAPDQLAAVRSRLTRSS